MTIEYRLQPNPLTSSKDLIMEVLSKDLIDLDEMSEMIHKENKLITAKTAKEVINIMITVIEQQLLDGYHINYSGLMRFITTMKGRLDLATDPAPTDPLDIKIIPSRKYREKLRRMAQFKRLEPVTLRPAIRQTVGAATQFPRYISADDGMWINGSNLQYEPLNTDEGVFIEDFDGVITKQENISMNENTRIIFNPTFPVQILGRIEYFLTVRKRFTENGQLRKTQKSRVRALNSNTNFIFQTKEYRDTPTMVIKSYVGIEQKAVFFCYFEGSNLMLKIKPFDGEYSDPVFIKDTDDVLEYTIQIANGTITFDIVNYDLLRDSCDNFYQGTLYEYFLLQP